MLCIILSHILFFRGGVVHLGLLVPAPLAPKVCASLRVPLPTTGCGTGTHVGPHGRWAHLPREASCVPPRSPVCPHCATPMCPATCVTPCPTTPGPHTPTSPSCSHVLTPCAHVSHHALTSHCLPTCVLLSSHTCPSMLFCISCRAPMCPTTPPCVPLHPHVSPVPPHAPHMHPTCPSSPS